MLPDVTPTLAAKNVSDNRLCDSETRPNLALRQLAPKRSYLSHLLLRKLRAANTLASHRCRKAGTQRVGGVLGRCIPFEVGGAIVEFDAVPMVGLRARAGRRTVKCSAYDTLEQELSRTTVDAHDGARIPRCLVEFGSVNVSERHASSNGPDAAQARHLVLPFEANHLAPLFIGKIGLLENLDSRPVKGGAPQVRYRSDRLAAAGLRCAVLRESDDAESPRAGLENLTDLRAHSRQASPDNAGEVDLVFIETRDRMEAHRPPLYRRHR